MTLSKAIAGVAAVTLLAGVPAAEAQHRGGGGGGGSRGGGVAVGRVAPRGIAPRVVTGAPVRFYRPYYTFRPRVAKNGQGQVFTSFLPAMSRDKLIDKGRQAHQWRLDRRTNGTLADLAEAINPIVRGRLPRSTKAHGSGEPRELLTRRCGELRIRCAPKPTSGPR